MLRFDGCMIWVDGFFTQFWIFLLFFGGASFSFFLPLRRKKTLNICFPTCLPCQRVEEYEIVNQRNETLSRSNVRNNLKLFSWRLYVLTRMTFQCAYDHKHFVTKSISFTKQSTAESLHGKYFERETKRNVDRWMKLYV